MEAAGNRHSGEAENKERTPFPPYFKTPNAVFKVGLSPYEIVVYANLSKHANDCGECYPSESTIAGETGIRSVKTVRKALRSLRERGFIVLVSPPGSLKKSATYRVRPFAVEDASKALARENQESDAPELNTPVRDTGEKNSTSTSAKKAVHRVLDTGGGRYVVPVTPVRDTYEGILKKEELVKEEKEKRGEKKSSQEKEAPPLCGAPSLQGDSTELREILSAQESLLTKTNRYYHALSQTEKETFNREARRIRRSKSMPSLVELRELRANFFGLMQFAQQTYCPSADEVEAAAKVLEESRTARIAEIELGH